MNQLTLLTGFSKRLSLSVNCYLEQTCYDETRVVTLQPLKLVSNKQFQHLSCTSYWLE